MSPRSLIVTVLVASCLGFGFAAAATYDFSAHLDRQVHNLHCSFIPGMASSSPTGSEGCHLTLMSPYSSLFRGALWGGLPVSVLAMSIFAAIAALTGLMLLLHAEEERSALSTLLLLGSIPVAASLVMGSIAAFKLHAACKQCIGIYIASAIVGIGALLAHTHAANAKRKRPGEFARLWFLSLPVTALLVGILTTSYVLAMPSYEKSTRGCGSLAPGDGTHDVFVHLSAPTPGAHKAIEIFDPLCPACKAFEERLRASGLDKQLQRELLLFPLDKACNWMVENTLHPGACAVSAAVLCAGNDAKAVMDWAFAEQREFETRSKSDEDAATHMLGERFPNLKQCMSSALTKQRLSQGLRWAVRNRVPVLTPQLYVDGQRLCDEDTDLGLEYTLTRMLKGKSP
jgi:hypothetical protein